MEIAISKLDVIWYILLWIVTYYYCRWLVIKEFSKNYWTWDSIIMYIVLSSLTLITIVMQSIVYRRVLFAALRRKLPNPPKWL